MIEIILDAGADINMQLKEGPSGTALEVATQYKSTFAPDMMRLLINRGADVNLGPTKGTYGSALAAAHSVQNIQALVRAGSNVKYAVETWRVWQSPSCYCC
jgi:hypothetical protein